MIESLRASDSSAERALGAFLDEHFYEVLHRSVSGFEYERVKDRKRQLEGMDVIVDYGGRRVIIDEKAALHYVNSSNCRRCKEDIVIRFQDGSTILRPKRIDTC